MLPRPMMNKFAVVAVITAMLTACGGDDKPSIAITGQIEIADDISIPADASARISIIEHRKKGGEEQIVAERTLHDVDRKPIKFEFKVARNLLVPDGRYGLSAELSDGDGQLLAESGKRRMIEPTKQTDAGRIRLEPSAPDTPAQFQQYRCEDGFHLAAAINDERAVVRLANRRLKLSADNGDSKYIDAHDNSLTRTEAGIRVHIDGAPHRQCTPVTNQAPKSTADSPNTSRGPVDASEQRDQRDTP